MEDTIAAIATPVGYAGIGIVRISGENAISIADQIFLSKKEDKKLEHVKSHTIHYGKIVEDGQIVDEVLVLVMRKPHTYTGEDVVEIDCHGGIIVIRKVLQAVLKYARLAEPGEFTKRAFLNGKMDLSQAEAVMDLIHAENEYALQNSLQQLNGSIKKKIGELRKNILHDLAFIEAALDDPEHIEIDGFSEELLEHILMEIDELEEMLVAADNGKILKHGIKTAIVGKPNVGKSSLLNLLSGKESAIVTDIAGTTRDVLEESVLLDGGIPLVLMDTAGIRNTGDQVEKIGIDRAKKSIEQAELILFLMDASYGVSKEDYEIANLLKKKRVIVLWNKIDLSPSKEEFLKIKKQKAFLEWKESGWIPFSIKEKIGLLELKEHINEMFFQGKISFQDEIYLTKERHKECILEAYESLKNVKESIESKMPEDFFSIDLMNAYTILGKMIGEQVDEDLVNTIFKEFCMGK